MLLRFFFHNALKQIYVLVQSTPDLQWQTVYPNGSRTRFRNLHMLARQAIDAGYPESECGLVPVAEAMFTFFMDEVSLQRAEQEDLRLVRYAQRIALYPALPQVLSQMPRWSNLFLMECASPNSGLHLFDVYRQGPEERLVCLTPLLTKMLPSVKYGSQPLLAVPLQGTYREAGAILIQAIEVRLWGRDNPPAYAYDVEKC